MEIEGSIINDIEQKQYDTATLKEWKMKQFQNKYFNGYHQEDEREEGPRKHGWNEEEDR